MIFKPIINVRKQFIGESALYFFIWVLVFLAPFMAAGLMSNDAIDIGASLLSWLKILPFLLLFIVNHLLLYRLLHRKYLYWVYYLIVVVLIVWIFSMLELYEQSDIAFAVSLGTIGQSFEAQHIKLTVFPWWGNMIAAALMLGANNVIHTFYRNMQDDEDSERLQRQNIQAEIYYLKHQINPHFLMNTLNNIHALVDIDSEAAKQTVIQLSDMMRYMVYETGGNSVPLKEEVKFMKNYIELMRIRYTDDVNISFDYPHSLQGRVDVPPLIFIVFVENAFKHGISYTSNSHINIKIDYKDNFVVGYFENSKSAGESTKKPGIGLENVRKRLELIYSNDYELDIAESETSYQVKLKIPTLNNYEMHRN